MYIDCIMFLFACLSVLLKDPRLISALVCLNLAFSSYFSCFEARFSAKTSMSSVSSCVVVKTLFFASISTIGSSIELFSQFRTDFLMDKSYPTQSILIGYNFVYKTNICFDLTRLKTTAF